MNFESSYRALARIESQHIFESAPHLEINVGGRRIVARAGASPQLMNRRHAKPELARKVRRLPRRRQEPIAPITLVDGLLRPQDCMHHLFRQHFRELMSVIESAERSPRLRAVPWVVQQALLSRMVRGPDNKPLVRCMAEADALRHAYHKLADPDDDWIVKAPEQLTGEALRMLVLDRLNTQLDPVGPANQARRDRQLKGLLRLHRNLHFLNTWLDGFPAEALHFVELNQFQKCRWQLVNLWVRAPDLRQLMEDSPTLAWIASEARLFQDRPDPLPLQSLRSLALKPRKQLLAWLGLPGSDGTLRLIRRFPCQELRRDMAAPISRVLKNPDAVRWLQNLPGTIGRETIDLLAAQTPVTFPILAAIHEGRKIEGTSLTVARCYKDVISMGARGPYFREAQQRLSSIGSIKKLHDLHDRMLEHLNRVRVTRSVRVASQWPGAIPSPLSPLPSWLMPLTTLDSVAKEGIYMNHCVWAHAKEVPSGDYYLYRVQHPDDRATLAIRRHRHGPGEWRVDQLSGVYNRKVMESVRQAIEQWIEGCLLKTGAGKEETQELGI